MSEVADDESVYSVLYIWIGPGGTNGVLEWRSGDSKIWVYFSFWSRLEEGSVGRKSVGGLEYEYSTAQHKTSVGQR
jgi:hypothetical protein